MVNTSDLKDHVLTCFFFFEFVFPACNYRQRVGHAFGILCMTSGSVACLVGLCVWVLVIGLIVSLHNAMILTEMCAGSTVYLLRCHPGS